MTGFEKFGRHGYVSQSKVTPLIEYLEKGLIVGTRCDKCNSLYFPPRADCPKCQNNKMTWTPLGNKCKLITFTEVYFSPPEFQEETPYLLGLAEMEAGTRVFAPISSKIGRSTLKPGLNLTLRPVKDGNGVFYQFETAEE